jgi:hypothetical protein
LQKGYRQEITQIINKKTNFTFLKRLISISFVILFLCSNTEMGQLLKLPNLLHHFLEHQKEHDADHNISFAEFIKIHYNDDQHHQGKDDQNHQNLPFKAITHNGNIAIAFQSVDIFSFCKSTTIFASSPVAFSEQFYTSTVFACIWLPPKLS